MVRIHRSRRTALGIALVLAGALVTPLAVTAEEHALSVAPAVTSWDETSGYHSVEASRVDMTVAVSPVAAMVANATAGDRSVEAIHARLAQQAFAAGDRGSGQEDALRAVVATVPSWDETSGYGELESQPSGDGTSGPLLRAPDAGRQRCAVGASTKTGARIIHRATSREGCEQALVFPDLGSMQEEALIAVVASGMSWEEISGYGPVGDQSRRRLGLVGWRCLVE